MAERIDDATITAATFSHDGEPVFITGMLALLARSPCSIISIIGRLLQYASAPRARALPRLAILRNITSRRSLTPLYAAYAAIVSYDAEL